MQQPCEDQKRVHEGTLQKRMHCTNRSLIQDIGSFVVFQFLISMIPMLQFFFLIVCLLRVIPVQNEEILAKKYRIRLR